MAPISSDMAAAMLEIQLQTRALSGLGGNTTSVALEITLKQENVLQILALVFSVISVASAILAFYWFMKMRRSFRHE